MRAGSSWARPDFYVSNGGSKCGWVKELRLNAKPRLPGSPLAPEQAGLVICGKKGLELGWSQTSTAKGECWRGISIVYF